MSRSAFVEFEYQSKSMQRIHLLSLALLSTVAASGAAVAGPLSLNPSNPSRQAPVASIYGAPSAQPAPQVRQPVAQAQYGGGLIEMLFGGPGRARSQMSQDPSNYRQYPADLGPGMVESPYYPGQAVQDPRYMKQ